MAIPKIHNAVIAYLRSRNQAKIEEAAIATKHAKTEEERRAAAKKWFDAISG